MRDSELEMENITERAEHISEPSSNSKRSFFGTSSKPKALGA
jgi:hypothetical protein